MTSGPSRLTYAHELYELLRWFGRLRWLAAATLATSSVVGGVLGIGSVWPGFLVLGVVVAAYNACFAWVLRRPVREDRPFAHQRIWAVSEILMDLGTLLVAAHLTGGLLSPVLPFFVFHMAIGTMLLSIRTMYAIAGVTSFSMFLVYLAEKGGVLPWHPVDPQLVAGPLSYDFSLLAIALTVFVVVYLTGKVTGESKHLNIQLSETTRQLRGKTDQLENALAEIREVEERKSHYMRISAHQLRSPLATIKASLQVLTQGYRDPSSERGQKLLNGTVSRVDELLSIVNDLLELAKIREGRANAPWTRNLDLSALVRETADAAVSDTDKQRVRSVCESADPIMLAWGVPPDLRFALENLVHNAVKYSPPEGEVRVTLGVVGADARITVSDQGIGIPTELQRDVFLEFVRAPNAKHHAPVGTGLGLSIAKEAVEMHSGRIRLESEEGVGTTFTIEIPLDAPLPEDAAAALRAGRTHDGGSAPAAALA